tara:strand:- start:235 stop:549 length:315 start_codon:yes stop_codon:yes gene_type:complete
MRQRRESESRGFSASVVVAGVVAGVVVVEAAAGAARAPLKETKDRMMIVRSARIGHLLSGEPHTDLSLISVGAGCKLVDPGLLPSQHILMPIFTPQFARLEVGC